MKLYRVDDLLSYYGEIGSYYIFAENLSDLGKILKDVRFDHYYYDGDGREILQKKEIDALQNVKDSAMHDHRLDMKTITITAFEIKPGLNDWNLHEYSDNDKFFVLENRDVVELIYKFISCIIGSSTSMGAFNQMKQYIVTHHKHKRKAL